MGKEQKKYANFLFSLLSNTFCSNISCLSVQICSGSFSFPSCLFLQEGLDILFVTEVLDWDGAIFLTFLWNVFLYLLAVWIVAFLHIWLVNACLFKRQSKMERSEKFQQEW